MKKRAICVMSVGQGKYLEQYKIVENQMKAYARKCNADFVFINDYLDKDKKRDIYSQKLLIADYMREYELAAFFDLDVVISPDAPDIFAEIPDGCGLAAVINPRGSAKFKKIYADNERILNETVEEYFVSRGFEADKRLMGNINGGVLVFRPALVADAFKQYYYSEHSQGGHTSYEEAPMAYYTQTHDMFYALDSRFNKMLHFESGRDEYSKIYNIHHNRLYCFADKVFKKLFHKNNMLVTNLHVDFVKSLINEGAYIVHMSGGFYSTSAAGKLMKIYGYDSALHK